VVSVGYEEYPLSGETSFTSSVADEAKSRCTHMDLAAQD